MKSLFLLFLLSLTLNTFASDPIREEMCIKDSCFSKDIGSKNEEIARVLYLKLVENIKLDISEYVYFTEEYRKYSKGNLDARFVHHFKWLKNESLVYVVVGKDYSALMLIKENNKRRVLYFNHLVSKFEIDFDTPDEFESITKLWVNNVVEIDIN